MRKKNVTKLILKTKVVDKLNATQVMNAGDAGDGIDRTGATEGTLWDITDYVSYIASMGGMDVCGDLLTESVKPYDCESRGVTCFGTCETCKTCDNSCQYGSCNGTCGGADTCIPNPCAEAEGYRELGDYDLYDSIESHNGTCNNSCQDESCNDTSGDADSSNPYVGAEAERYREAGDYDILR